jgi:hypothetical protein
MQPEPKPPKHLKRDGRAFYIEIAGEYRLTDGAGLALLTTAAAALDRMREAQRDCEGRRADSRPLQVHEAQSGVQARN